MLKYLFSIFSLIFIACAASRETNPSVEISDNIERRQFKMHHNLFEKSFNFDTEIYFYRLIKHDKNEFNSPEEANLLSIFAYGTKAEFINTLTIKTDPERVSEYNIIGFCGLDEERHGIRYLNYVFRLDFNQLKYMYDSDKVILIFKTSDENEFMWEWDQTNISAFDSFFEKYIDDSFIISDSISSD